MSMPVKLAVDAMGGDHAPHMVIEGVVAAARRYPNVHFLLFGKEDQIKPLVDSQSAMANRYDIIHCDEVITSDMKPSQAIRGLSNSSMKNAIKAVADGQAQGVISAGNTGAYLALTKIILKTLPGIDRPALASLVPSMCGESVMMDLGANLECSPKNLLQFAIMGEMFARYVLSHPKPSIGLLNVGSEDTKGSPIVQEAAELIKQSCIAEHFYGFIEGDDITKGTVDVIVTDGFTGNAVLKAGEGVMQLSMAFISQAFKSSIFARIGYLFARPMVKKLTKRLDHRQYNGGIWLGLNGIAVKSHGGTDYLGFAHSIDYAVDMITSKINDHIIAELEAGSTPSPKVLSHSKVA